jgi:small subunit ribosomal protein S3
MPICERDPYLLFRSIKWCRIAKIECRKYDETSLHVFSNQIDYAKAQTSTPYGILGVKVWVSYF